MKKFYSKLSLAYKTVVITALVTVVIYLGFLFGYFNNCSDLPNGIIFGGFIGIISYLLTAVAEQLDNKKGRVLFSIIAIVIRFIIIGAMLFLVAMMNYQWDLHIFNIFTFFGGYMVSLVVFLVLHLLEKANV